jgi:hypothetical protein
VTLGERKRIEIERKLGSLETELARWNEVAKKDKPLQKHHSQLETLTAQLGAAMARVQAQFAAFDLARSQRLEAMVVDLHRIWEYFRAKLALRHVSWLKTFLDVADELAFECYEAARRRAVAASYREPPLVFLEGHASPLSHARGAALPDDGGVGALSSDELRAAVQTIPIPLVGVPWFQLSHLPDALLIAHETGHLVEADFALTSTLRELVARAPLPAEHRPAWEAWSGELFADSYGVVAGGAAFVGALMDFLALDVARISGARKQAPSWGLYPTAALRIHYNLCALAIAGLTRQSDELRAEWQAQYPTHAMAELEPEAEVVAQALLGGPYPAFGEGAALTSLFPVREAHGDAERAADKLRGRVSLDATASLTLVAAARLAFAAGPREFGERKLQNVVIERVLAARPPGTRGGRGARAAHDGDALFPLLERAADRAAAGPHASP